MTTSPLGNLNNPPAPATSLSDVANRPTSPHVTIPRFGRSVRIDIETAMELVREFGEKPAERKTLVELLEGR